MSRGKDRSGAGLGTTLRYRFDNALSRGPFVVIAYLGVLTLLVVLVAGLIATVLGLTFGDGEESFFEKSYQSLLRMLDAGTFTADTSSGLRVLTLLVTLIGIILAGSLIGLIANAVDQKVDLLQRGRGRVVEKGHSLILGWSPQVPQIIAELVTANESEKRACIVVLARADKTEMEEALRDELRDTKTTRVVIRNGDPALPSDLERVCISDARSIVAVRDEDGDASVIKAVLAVRALDPTHARSHIVAELNDPDHARTLRAVSHGRVVTVSSESIVAEVTAQACYQSGLAAVFADLLDFDGDEIYFAPIPQVAGHTYAEAQLAFESSSLIGRLTAGGTVQLNPSPETTIDDGDQLILVAQDDSAVAFSGFRPVQPSVVSSTVVDDPRPVRVLIVGWSMFGGRVLKELDEFLVTGSSIHVQVDTDLVALEELQDISLANATLTTGGGRGGPEDLLALATQEAFDQVIVLAYRDALSASDADARTLLSLLTLRLMWPADAPDHVRVVAELVDQRNVVIAAPAGIDDLIISDALASLMMAQLSERAELLTLFEELFAPEGAVVLMLPADRLVAADAMPWGDVVAATGAQSASAFGYRLHDTGKVVLNPKKSHLVTLGPKDRVVAIGERVPTPRPAVAAKAAPRQRRRKAPAA